MPRTTVRDSWTATAARAAQPPLHAQFYQRKSEFITSKIPLPWHHTQIKREKAALSEHRNSIFITFLPNLFLISLCLTHAFCGHLLYSSFAPISLHFLFCFFSLPFNFSSLLMQTSPTLQIL
ncbi:hypothetical protein VNO80_19976 [Phaseolus coccineus]|uniref:Uncharacterized protein n=1 Tax=Phaseolus coccineus TaxID=3886 RepID=A0AAN9R0B9_PHACN